MTVTSVEKDFDHLTLTLTAEFDAPVEQVWELWADPRKLERWWGPPTYPATFERFELRAGGEVTYYMTSPEGEKYRGYWRVIAVDAPKSLEFRDGFADADGHPVVDMGMTRGRVELTDEGGSTRMQLVSTFESREHMTKLDEMGMSEGLTLAAGQMDALLTV